MWSLMMQNEHDAQIRRPGLSEQEVAERLARDTREAVWERPNTLWSSLKGLMTLSIGWMLHARAL